MKAPIQGTGPALITGSVMMFVTMILHPAGELEDKQIGMIVHALAILSIPVSLSGYYGLSRFLGDRSILSSLAFISAAAALFAALVAAGISGFAYYFFHEFYDSSTTSISSKEAVLDYSYALNQAMALIYVGLISLSYMLWSIVILQTEKLAHWLGYLGILIGLIFVVLLVTGTNLTDLNGFRVFIFGSVGWVVLAGSLLMRIKEAPE